MEWSNIRVDIYTKDRLKKRKKHRTFNDEIATYLDYFEATGVKPNEVQTSPISIVKKRSDDIISIVRGIEKKQMPYLKKIEGMLELIYNDKKSNLEGAITDDEAEKLHHHLEKLEGDLATKKQEITALKKQLLEAKNIPQNNDNNDLNFAKKEIKKQLQILIDSGSTSMINKSHIQFPNHIFNSVKDSIYNLVK